MGGLLQWAVDMQPSHRLCRNPVVEDMHKKFDVHRSCVYAFLLFVVFKRHLFFAMSCGHAVVSLLVLKAVVGDIHKNLNHKWFYFLFLFLHILWFFGD
jgi:hypothetical protein